MTDHQPEAGPVDVPAEQASTEDRLRAMFSQTEQSEPPQDEAEPEQEVQELEDGEEYDEPDDSDIEDGEAEGEQETAIAAPISFNAEEREVFSQLQPEAQAFITEVETRRNANVTKVTTKAAEAQRLAEANAAQQVNQAKQEFAWQLEAITANFAPQKPNPSLAQNPETAATYVAAMAQYDAEIGQFEQMKHQIAAIRQQAEQEGQAAFVQERDKALMQIPEIANQETRQEYLDRVFNPDLMQSLGYEASELAQIADAEDVKRLNYIAGLKQKADKYDAAMKKKMKPVREAKARATKPGLVQDKTNKNRALSEAMALQKQTGGKDGTEQALRAKLFG